MMTTVVTLLIVWQFLSSRWISVLKDRVDSLEVERIDMQIQIDKADSRSQDTEADLVSLRGEVRS